MIKTYWVRILASCMVLGVVGCMGVAPPSASVEAAPTSTQAPDPGQTPGPEQDMRLTPTLPGGLERVPATPSAPVTGEVPEGLLAAILDDLVARAGLQREAVQIVEAEAVVWSDGSLGCPQPGMMYTQALVEGYRVVLEVDGKQYDYHASDRGTFFLCEQTLKAPQATPLTLDDFVQPPGSENE